MDSVTEIALERGEESRFPQQRITLKNGNKNLKDFKKANNKNKNETTFYIIFIKISINYK
uniref:Uncharacterized protein n=1 Tax=Chlamydia pneumoniae TaxID=83558 RepID=A0A0F7WQI2_CHLPN|nr:hypothetical protein BN1224_CV15_C_04300 [Chlamydia pneumoniae]